MMFGGGVLDEELAIYERQIMSVLKHLEAGVSVAELSRDHNVSTATLYQWRAKYGGIDALMIKRLKELEAEIG